MLCVALYYLIYIDLLTVGMAKIGPLKQGFAHKKIAIDGVILALVLLKFLAATVG